MRCVRCAAFHWLGGTRSRERLRSFCDSASRAARCLEASLAVVTAIEAISTTEGVRRERGTVRRLFLGEEAEFEVAEGLGG